MFSFIRNSLSFSFFCVPIEDCAHKRARKRRKKGLHDRPAGRGTYSFHLEERMLMCLSTHSNALPKWKEVPIVKERQLSPAQSSILFLSFLVSADTIMKRKMKKKMTVNRWLSFSLAITKKKRKERALTLICSFFFHFFVYDRQGLLFDPGQHVKKKEIVGRASLGIMIANAIAKRRSKRRLDRRLVSQELIVGLIKREKRTAHNNKLLKDTTAGPTFPSHSVGFQSSSYCWPS